MRFLKFTFSLLLTVCLSSAAGNLHAQSIPDVATYSWKTKERAIEAISLAPQASGSNAGEPISVAPVKGPVFEQLLFEIVVKKISADIAIPTAIEEGFSEAVSITLTDGQYAQITTEDHVAAVTRLIDLIKE